MKKSFLLLPILFLFTFTLQAQDSGYGTAVGARLGSPLSASIKHFIGEGNHAVEAYVGTRGYSGYRFTSISVAYQIHKPLDIIEVGNLTWYYGAGASVYFWNWDNNFFTAGEDYNSTTFGIQGYLGLDYKFEGLPINISIDWVPTYFVSGYSSGFGSGYGAIGVRYVLR